MSNTFGNLFKIHTFGESHGAAIGVVIDGCPAGIKVDLDLLQAFMDKRKPGQSSITTQRKESDLPVILSGVFGNKTTGAPIALTIANNDAQSKDYEAIKDIYRPSHADYTYDQKYGLRDYRGGGRSSARTTAAWSMGAAFAAMMLKAQTNIEIKAYTHQIYTHTLSKNPTWEMIAQTNNIVHCPDEELALKMIEAIEQASKEGDSLGGQVGCIIHNIPVGLGEPQGQKLQAMLAHAMLSINAVKGFQYGLGFDETHRKGSEINDEPLSIDSDKGMITKNNYSGGILGGISNGEDIYFKLAFKPTATIAKSQKTVNADNQEETITVTGRHDPCVVPRACALVEAMSWLVMADAWLLAKTQG